MKLRVSLKCPITAGVCSECRLITDKFSNELRNYKFTSVGFSKKQRPEIYKKCDGKCGYCGEPIEIKDMQADHIIPQRNFIWHIKNNMWIPEFLRHLTWLDCDNIDNAMPSCRVCNKRKDTYHLELFREELEMQVDRAAKTSANYRMALKYGQITENKHPIVFYFERV